MERTEIIKTCTGPPGIASIPHIHIKTGTYTIISKVAYLIGISLRIFENVNEPPKLEIYQELKRDKNARIVRNLCRLRTAIEQNFKAINERMIYDYKSLYVLPELVPVECIDQLNADGIIVIKSKRTLTQYIIEINRLLSDRINNCLEVFPI